GSARRSARRESDRRFRSSSDRDRANIAGFAAALSRTAALGGLRTALEHDAARNFSKRTSGSAQAGGRRFYLPGGTAGTNPGSRTITSGRNGQGNFGRWTSGVLRKKRR